MTIGIIKNRVKMITVSVKWFFADILGFIKSVLFYFRSIKKPALFRGYKSYWFASKYKARRENKWSVKWDQMGRQQGIFPLDETTLIVCSKMELTIYKKKGLINKNIKPRKLMKKSY
jgi:hypothetical protein